MRISMLSITSVTAVLLLTGVALDAAYITGAENFDTTALGEVPTGWQRDWGTAAQGGQTTTAVGINASNAFVGSDILMSTTSTFDLTAGTSYDFAVSFKFDGSGTLVNSGFLGVGFTDAASGLGIYNAGGGDRFMVGIAITPNQSEYTLAVGGQLNGMSTTINNQFGSTFSLTAGNWFTFAGTVNYTDATSTFNFSNLSVDNIGTDGLSTPTSVISGGSFSKAVFATNGNTLDDTAARFFVGANKGRGISTIDNINPIPEPSTIAFFGGLIFLGLTFLRRCR